MLTAVEQRFMERVPNLLVDLIKEMEKLRKEVSELNAKLDNKTEE